MIAQFELHMCFLNSVKSTFYDIWTLSFSGKVSFLSSTLYTDTRDSFDILKQKNYQERNADHCLMSYDEALIWHPFERVTPWVSTWVKRKKQLLSLINSPCLPPHPLNKAPYLEQSQFHYPYNYMYFCSKIFEKKDNFILHLIHELSALNHKKKIAQKTGPTKNI